MTGDIRTGGAGADRLAGFSDAVIAVIITIMVLELKAPDTGSPAALVALWPTALSYAVSYLFIAIIWINHHHLMRFVRAPASRLIWLNFLHLFLVSLIPFATQWAARTSLAPAAVAAWAFVFVCVDGAYLLFERAVMAQADCTLVTPDAQRRAGRRAKGALMIFAVAAASAAVSAVLGVALIVLALSLFLRPEVPGIRMAAAEPGWRGPVVRPGGPRREAMRLKRGGKARPRVAAARP
jgi:uncharacterized membrane protein